MTSTASCLGLRWLNDFVDENNFFKVEFRIGKTKETSKVKTEVWQLPAEDTKDAKLSFIYNKFLAYMDDAYSSLENLADTKRKD